MKFPHDFTTMQEKKYFSIKTKICYENFSFWKTLQKNIILGNQKFPEYFGPRKFLVFTMN